MTTNPDYTHHLAARWSAQISAYFERGEPRWVCSGEMAGQTITASGVFPMEAAENWVKQVWEWIMSREEALISGH